MVELEQRSQSVRMAWQLRTPPHPSVLEAGRGAGDTVRSLAECQIGWPLGQIAVRTLKGTEQWLLTVAGSRAGWAESAGHRRQPWGLGSLPLGTSWR